MLYLVFNVIHEEDQETNEEGRVNKYGVDEFEHVIYILHKDGSLLYILVV